MNKLVNTDETVQTGEDVQTDAPVSKPWTQRIPWRVVGTAAFLLGLYLIGWATGALEYMTVDKLQSAVLDAGVWGVILFLAAFVVGLLLQVPGMIFVAVAVLVYGRWSGGALALGGALLAMSITFWTVRTLGGSPLDKIQKKWMRKILDRLEKSPFWTVVVLRLVSFLSPPVNYALALSPIRYRDYLAGSAVGLVVPIGLVVSLSDCFLV